ncbi:zinc ribbon domain-containing protein [bacterium]|jgi:hypothetical protein|nr:zinc ribbon domain-containing protein [bacterium]
MNEDIPVLIVCNSCKNNISISAQTCPSCGAVNTYVFPKIQQFKSISTEELVAMFPKHIGANWISERLLVTGTQETNSLSPLLILLGGMAFVSTIIISLLNVLGFNLVDLGAKILIFSIISIPLGYLLSSEKKFTADFSEGYLKWNSNDDDYWKAVEKFFRE